MPATLLTSFLCHILLVVNSITTLQTCNSVGRAGGLCNELAFLFDPPPPKICEITKSIGKLTQPALRRRRNHKFVIEILTESVFLLSRGLGAGTQEKGCSGLEFLTPYLRRSETLVTSQKSELKFDDLFREILYNISVTCLVESQKFSLISLAPKIFDSLFT